jgi:hypothetical protein
MINKFLEPAAVFHGIVPCVALFSVLSITQQRVRQFTQNTERSEVEGLRSTLVHGASIGTCVS